MYLYIYSPDLISLGAVDFEDTLIWIRRDTEYGSFELTAPATTHNIELLKKYNIVRKDSDLEIAYINSISITSDSDKGEIIKATGLFYCGVLKQRCVLKNTTKNLKSLIDENVRGLSLINVDSSAVNITYTNDFVGENLGECITALAKAQGFGFKTMLNKSTGKIDFSVYYGIDRSTGQTVNPYCIFSDNLENLSESEYTNSDIGCVNTVYARCKVPAGVENPSDAPTYNITAGTGTGIFEKYVWVDAVTYDVDVVINDTEETIKKTYIAVSTSLAELTAAAKAELIEIQENFQGTVDFKLKYRTDYDIGDVVTIKNTKWQKSINQRITEVTEVYDNTSNSITPTFGNPARTILDILKKVK